MPVVIVVMMIKIMVIVMIMDDHAIRATAVIFDHTFFSVREAPRHEK
jgi:hypothetical protein